FGCCDKQTDYWIRVFRKEGCVVIEDITQTLFDKRDNKLGADYYVASLRKWFAIPAGGWLGKTVGNLSVKPDEPGDEKTESVIRGMNQKAKYIAGESDDKKSYIVDLSGFEEWLVLLNCKTQIDKISESLLHQVDISKIIEQQKKNAGYLYGRLHDIEGIEIVNSYSDCEKKCPLYMPILLSHDKRNILQSELEKQGIYCPVTWSERMGASSGIRDRELSLICDYRYTEQDMERIAAVVLAVLES
ncbi:MAG: hypothetical protein IKO32_05185, partial [Lachnospiraceae bacterium]|nr:hypothetical protein [Lachnospiraceae bacterium]